MEYNGRISRGFGIRVWGLENLLPIVYSLQIPGIAKHLMQTFRHCEDVFNCYFTVISI